MSLFFFAAASIASVASAQSNVTSIETSTSLETVSEYTTYLESATQLVENNVTYTATGPTTLTVSDCPCTRTHTFTTQYVTVCSASETVAASSGDVAANGASANSPWFMLVAPLMMLL